jgi:hypothetical protein
MRAPFAGLPIVISDAKAVEETVAMEAIAKRERVARKVDRVRWEKLILGMSNRTSWRT